MGSPSSPGSTSAYLESLMHAGRQATKKFDEALAAAMGFEAKAGKNGQTSPFAATADLQQQVWSPVLDFWRGFYNDKPEAKAGSPVRAPRGDRRFKDEVWSQSPYYDLLKQSYLSNSKQLTDFVDQAQVDDRSKLQLRFYARQFIDAMSPANFPATNPEVIRTAIQTRCASLAAGMQNLIVRKGVSRGSMKALSRSAAILRLLLERSYSRTN